MELFVWSYQTNKSICLVFVCCNVGTTTYRFFTDQMKKLLRPNRKLATYHSDDLRVLRPWGRDKAAPL